MAIRRESFFFTLVLGALAGLPSVAIDMGLPGFPAIEATFPDAAGRAPLTLSFFFVGFAISPLICGPIADRFGRRPTLLAGLVAFAAAAAGAAAAGSFPVLLGVRIVQGLAAGACVVLPLAIVRDLFEGMAARHRMSQVTAVLGITPMVAPIFGAWVMGVDNWRAIYATQAVAALILLAMIAFGIGESLPIERRRSLNPVQLVNSYRMVLSNRPFRAFALTYALGFACMFSFIAGSPAVLMGSLGLSKHAFSLLFALTACGVMLGSLVSARLSSRQVASRRILTFGFVLMLASAFAAFGLSLTPFVSAYTLTPLMFLVIFCFGLTAPQHEPRGDARPATGRGCGVRGDAVHADGDGDCGQRGDRAAGALWAPRGDHDGDHGGFRRRRRGRVRPADAGRTAKLVVISAGPP